MVLVLPFFNHLNWLMVKMLFYYLVSMCVLFQFSKQTLIYPIKVLYSVPCLRLEFYLLLDSSKEY